MLLNANQSKFLIVEVLKRLMLKCSSHCTPSRCAKVGKCSCQCVLCVLLLLNVPLDSSTFPSDLSCDANIQRGYSLTLVSCCFFSPSARPQSPPSCRVTPGKLDPQRRSVGEEGLHHPEGHQHHRHRQEQSQPGTSTCKHD